MNTPENLNGQMRCCSAVAAECNIAGWEERKMILASEMVASNNVIMFFSDNARKIGYKSTYAINQIWKENTSLQFGISLTFSLAAYNLSSTTESLDLVPQFPNSNFNLIFALDW